MAKTERRVIRYKPYALEFSKDDFEKVIHVIFRHQYPFRFLGSGIILFDNRRTAVRVENLSGVSGEKIKTVNIASLPPEQAKAIRRKMYNLE